MQRVHWTLDLHEAEILAGLLRAEGIHAFVFNEGVVRVASHQALAYGGYRVMARTSQLAQAAACIAAWRNGEFALPDNHTDTLPCPRCRSASTQADMRPRGWAFVILMLTGLPLPWRLQHRMRCRQCNTRWIREPLQASPHDHAH